MTLRCTSNSSLMHSVHCTLCTASLILCNAQCNHALHFKLHSVVQLKSWAMPCSGWWGLHQVRLSAVKHTHGKKGGQWQLKAKSWRGRSLEADQLGQGLRLNAQWIGRLQDTSLPSFSFSESNRYLPARLKATNAENCCKHIFWPISTTARDNVSSW